MIVPYRIKLGIISGRARFSDSGNPFDLGYETFSLYSEAQKIFDNVLLINPKNISFCFTQNNNIQVFHQGQEITGVSSLIVRSMARRTQSTALLVHSLKASGCDVLDSLVSFSGGKSTKLIPTLSLHKSGCGINSYVIFQIEDGLRLINELEKKGVFPLLAKPINGSRGRGVILLHHSDDALKHLRQFFTQQQDPDTPLLLQDYIEFVAEYRVISVLGECIGVAQKNRRPGTIAANAAQGATFTNISASEIVSFVSQNVSKDSILGVDVGQDKDGKKYIIEANYAPQWRTFEQATGINVARRIVQKAYSRLV